MSGNNGSNGTTRGQNIAEQKSDGLVMISYAIPHRRSTLNVLFGNEKYTDLVLPSYNFNQNREAIDFTTRF